VHTLLGAKKKTIVDFVYKYWSQNCKMQADINNVSRDYAKILQSADLEKEINPLCTNIDDMMTRLDEFETLLSSVSYFT